MVLRVNAEKFRNLKKLNRQIRIAMIRYRCWDGVFEIGDSYETTGMVKLILR